MNYIKYSIIIIILLQSLSCTKSYTYDFDDIEKHIVVNSLFSPDSTIRFHLTEEAGLSEDVLPNSFKKINNAQIIIYENNIIVDSAKYTEDGNYYADIKPGIDTKYSIRINAAGYDEVYAEDKIPTPVKIDSIITSKKSDGDGYSYYKVKIIFNDPEDTENYYFLYVYWKKEYEGIIWRDEAYIKTEDPAIGEWRTQSFQLPIFNDEIFNGKRYELSFELYPSSSSEKQTYCYFELRSISKNMYLYLKSYNNQTPKFGDDLMEYFQRGLIEPIPIYTNVEGGLGIFAGYAVSRDSVYFD